MDIKELVIDQWYAVRGNYNIVFQFGGILDKNCIKLTHYFNHKVKRTFQTASNPDFWKMARVLSPEDMENSVPSKYHHLITCKSYELWI